MEAISSPVPTIDHRKVPEVHAPCFSHPVLKRRGRLRERLFSTVGRPPEQLSASALLMELVPRYFDPRAVTAVMGHREEVTELLKLPFDFIFFTGSTKVGRIVMKAAAENLTPVLLELGGQNPALVDETANIADAAKKIVWGAMAWGGQWCTSPGYAYVHESVADAFVAEARKAVVELSGEDPKTNPDYSRVVSAREVSRLAGLIDPAKVVAGGQSDPDARYLDPTIVYPVTWDDPIMEDEVELSLNLGDGRGQAAAA
jgi:aldehyde dehydrogenase (NAD+)